MCGGYYLCRLWPAYTKSSAGWDKKNRRIGLASASELSEVCVYVCVCRECSVVDCSWVFSLLRRICRISRYSSSLLSCSSPSICQWRIAARRSFTELVSDSMVLGRSNVESRSLLKSNQFDLPAIDSTPCPRTRPPVYFSNNSVKK